MAYKKSAIRGEYTIGKLKSHKHHREQKKVVYGNISLDIPIH